MTKKVFTLFIGYFLLTAITGLVSCENCGPSPDKFKVSSIDWNTYKVTLTTDNLALSEIGNGVIFNQLGIQLKPKTQTYFSSIKHDYSLASGLYACDPVTPTTVERVVNMEITADKDFSVGYPQGTDLSELFDIVITDWYRRIYADKYDLKQYLQTNPSVPLEMTLILKQAPQTEDTYRFSIKYFQDGVDLDYAEFTTSDIFIMK